MKQDLVTIGGSHLGPSVRTGNIFKLEATVGGVTNFVSSAPGVLTSPYLRYSCVPLEDDLSVDGTTAAIMLGVQVTAPGYQTLRGLPAGTPKTGLYLDFVKGIPSLRLPVPGSLNVAVYGSGGSPSLACNVTINGFDIFGNPMSALEAVAAGLTATTILPVLKSFANITSVYVDSASGCQIAVGLGTSFGLPYFTSNQADVLQSYYGTTEVNLATNFVAPAAPSTATSNDTRGMITVSGAIDDVTALVTHICVVGGDASTALNYDPVSNSWTSATTQEQYLATYGSPQYVSPLFQ